MSVEFVSGGSLTYERDCPACFPQVAKANKLNKHSPKSLFLFEMGGGNR